MAKKHFGKIITLAALAGAATAAISYFLKYKSFHKELDEDFHDFEDDFEEFEEPSENSGNTRSYVSLNPERQAEKTDEASAETVKDEKSESCPESADGVKEDAQAEDNAPISESTANTTTTIVEDIIE